MRIKNTDMVTRCLQQIERLQEHQKAIHAALNAVRMVRGPGRSDIDAGGLDLELHRLELDEWRKLAMWGLTLDDAERDRIKAAAYDRFLNDGQSACLWLSADGRTPGAWSGADEAEFRDMARAAFAPKG